MNELDESTSSLEPPSAEAILAEPDRDHHQQLESVLSSPRPQNLDDLAELRSSLVAAYQEIPGTYSTYISLFLLVKPTDFVDTE